MAAYSVSTGSRGWTSCFGLGHFMDVMLRTRAVNSATVCGVVCV